MCEKGKEEVHVGASNFCVMDIGGEVGYQERAQLVEGAVFLMMYFAYKLNKLEKTLESLGLQGDPTSPF